MASMLVIASSNAGKVREFGHLLAELQLKIRPQPEGLEVEETGDTFAANAQLKASAVARASGHRYAPRADRRNSPPDQCSPFGG